MDLPVTLKILAGKRWRGKMTVKSRLDDGRYVVAFDAQDVVGGEFIYDVATMSPELIEQWTGTNPSGPRPARSEANR